MARFLFILAFLAFSTAVLRDSWEDWVARTELPQLLAETSVEVRGQNDVLLRVFPVENGRQRLAVHLDDVDPEFIDMLIEFEDKRFWQHSGVDARAVLRAGVQAVWNGRVISGGSTLSMQAARLLENSGTGRWSGKLRQMRVAWALEARLSKSDILTLYLQHAPYGGAVEGIRAGSLAWFGKEPKRLTPAQSALLIALPQAPETRRPDRHPLAAEQARNRVLVRADLENTRGVIPSKMTPFPRLAPHLGDQLRRQHPLSPIHRVTLDARLQAQLENLALWSVRGQAKGVSAAIFVVDHTTGKVLASVGSSSYSSANGALGFVDMTRAVRSPGSTLKPLIYGLAFDQGLAHPETIFNDSLTAFGSYVPRNFDGQFRGEVTAREALQLSLNIPPVQLVDAMGPTRLMAGMKRAGATPKLPGNGAPGLAVALGGVGLTLQDLVQIFAGIAQGGKGLILTSDTQENVDQTTRFMSPRSAWYVSNILGGLAPPAGAQQGRLAYKTGTSYGHRDAWAIGFDGQHVVGVWMGHPDGTPVPGAFGGDLAAPIMFEAFGRIKPDFEPLPSPPADALILPTARLPKPLQNFGNRRGQTNADDLRVAFPPDGAVLEMYDDLPLKLRGGTAPFTVLVNDGAQITGLRGREVFLSNPGLGFSRISVVDATGQSQAIQIQLTP
ncbi:MAG: penicillin-binding protein 1C [Ascidiaceihabitans sp.]|jgi:penicillin-binding protein 1C